MSVPEKENKKKKTCCALGLKVNWAGSRPIFSSAWVGLLPPSAWRDGLALGHLLFCAQLGLVQWRLVGCSPSSFFFFFFFFSSFSR
jgi:hypothetical protein